jgi:hypothetical protein
MAWLLTPDSKDISKGALREVIKVHKVAIKVAIKVHKVVIRVLQVAIRILQVKIMDMVLPKVVLKVTNLPTLLERDRLNSNKGTLTV